MLSKQFDKLQSIGLFLIILPFFLLSLYNYPAGFDDFNNAVLVNNLGELGFNRYMYNQWSGRYTLSLILTFFNPIKYGFWSTGIKLVPIVILILLLSSVQYVLRSDFNWNKNNSKIFLFSMTFVALFLYGVPSISEIIYWFTGAATYTTGIIFSLLFLGSIIRCSASVSTWSRIGYLLLCILCLLAAIGTNESTLMAILFLVTTFMLYSLILKSGNRYFFILIFFFAILAALFSIGAPGNTVRSLGMYGGENIYSFQRLIKAGIQSLYFSTINLIGWINNFALIIASLLFTPSAVALIRESKWLKRVTSINPILCFLVTILFLSSQAFPSYLGMTDVDTRVWSSIYFFFLLSWTFNWLVLVNFFSHYLEKVNYKELAPFKLLLIFILLFSAQGNINNAYLDLFVRAPQYSANLEKRYNIILASSGKDLIVPPIFKRLYKYPRTIHSTDITTDISDYRNTSLSEYFNLKSIRLDKEPLR